MKYLIIMIFSLITNYAFAQITVKGKVVNEKGEAMFAANIFEKSNQKNGCVSGFDGRFSLNLKSNNRTIVISFIGYKSKEIAVNTIDLSKEIVVMLRPSSKNIEEVIVKAQDPISKKFSVVKMNKYNIYFNAMAQGDPLKAITILPASTTVDETANPSLRGSAADRTRVMLNGVPIYTPVRNNQLNNQGFFSLFNTEIIHRQYVYAGNPPLTYGNTSAGLVEIQTLKKLQQNICHFTLSIGSIGGFVSQELKENRSFVQVFGNIQKSDAFTAIQKKNLPELKSFNTKDIGINFYHKINKQLEFNSFNYFVDEAFKVEYHSLNYMGEANASKKRFFSVNNLKYYTTIGVFTLNNGIDASKQDFQYGSIHSKNRINRLFLSLNYKKEISENIDLQSGISYESHKNKFNDILPEYYFLLQPEAPKQFIKTTIHNPILEAYAYSNWNINKKLILSAGLRSNIPLKHQKQYVSTQLALKYNINKKQSILLSGGNYNSYATPNYYNKVFSLQKSRQISCDYSFFSKKLGIKGAVYYKYEKGQRNLNSYTAVDKIKTFGVELYAEYKLSDDFKITASNLFIDQKLNKDGKSYHGNYDFNYLVKASIQYVNFKWFTASLSYIGRPGRYYTPINGVRTVPNFNYAIPNFSGAINSAQYDSYNKIDFTMNRYTPIGSTAIIPFLSVSNIFNIKNQRNDYYNSDYTKRHFDNYKKRVIYFGIIWQL